MLQLSLGMDDLLRKGMGSSSPAVRRRPAGPCCQQLASTHACLLEMALEREALPETRCNLQHMSSGVVGHVWDSEIF